MKDSSRVTILGNRTEGFTAMPDDVIQIGAPVWNTKAEAMAYGIGYVRAKDAMKLAMKNEEFRKQLMSELTA